MRSMRTVLAVSPAEEELERLRAENELLRQSARAFGELAERLNLALRVAAASTGCGDPARIQAQTVVERHSSY